MSDNSSNGNTSDVDLVEFHLKSVGLDPRNRQVFEDFADIAIKVKEEGLAEGRAVFRVAAEALQAVYRTREINEKEARGEELTPMDRLSRYYTMVGPPKASGPTPSFERLDDDRSGFEKLNEYFKRKRKNLR
jgi:hypothetical protein